MLMGCKTDCSELKCGTCELNKAESKPVPKNRVDRAINALDIVHVDISGPVTPVSVDNHRYSVSFVVVMKTRDECLQYFQQFCGDLGRPQRLVYRKTV